MGHDFLVLFLLMFENSNIERTVDVRCEFFIFGYGFCIRSVNRGHFVIGRQVGEDKRICKTIAMMKQLTTNGSAGLMVRLLAGVMVQLFIQLSNREESTRFDYLICLNVHGYFDARTRGRCGEK